MSMQNGLAEDWFTFNQKNKPQGNTLFGGILALFVSGFQMAWIFNKEILKFEFAAGRSDTVLTLVKMSWFLTAIFGLILGSFALQKKPKKHIYIVGGIFCTASNIWLVSMPNKFEAILVSRLLAGVAYGVSYVTVLVHGSEIINQRQRGMVLTTIHFLMMTAVTVFGSMTMALKEEETLHPLRLIGIISLILSIVSIVVTFIFTEESPVALIRQKMKREALQVMIKVRSETEENVAIRNEFNELKAMVEEDELNNKGIFSDGNARPLLIIFLMKAAFVLSFNYPLNMVMLNSSTILDDKNDISVSILSAARMIPMVVVLFTIEIGRRPHFLLGSTGAAILLIGLGIIFQVNETPSNNLVLTLIIAFQIFAGIGLGHISDVMASEAFNSLKKARSIAFVTSLELILQMILIAIFQLTDSTNSARVIILSACGACILPITILLYFKLPETAKMSIRQSRSEFSKRGALVYSGTKMPTEGINVF